MRRLLSIAVFLGVALVAVPQPAIAAPPPYYPPIDWIPAARSNYDVGRTRAIVAIVIHETDGTYLSAVNWFQNPRSQVSAHYVVRAYGGGITQLVAESDTAYHAKLANPWSIGIEHEFFPRYGIYHTDAQYRASAQLVCAIARRYQIPTDRAHIIGHNEVPGSDHRDPGPTWNWVYYMSLVNQCSWQRPTPASRGGLRTVANNGFVPSASLEYDAVSDEVALLQWDLAYLGFIDPDEVAGGGGHFGPLTQAAIEAYQGSSGVAPTGLYDEPTAAALAQSITANPIDLPATDLAPEAESDDVSKLQAALEQLGYIDRVTGYYGPMTTDAVSSFQSDNGIWTDGTYGAITRMALAVRMRPPATASDLTATEATPNATPFAIGDTAAMILP